MLHNVQGRRYCVHEYTIVYPCSTESWDSELSNGIWHAYITRIMSRWPPETWLWGALCITDERGPLCNTKFVYPWFWASGVLAYLNFFFLRGGVVTLHLNTVVSLQEKVPGFLWWASTCKHILECLWCKQLLAVTFPSACVLLWTEKGEVPGDDVMSMRTGASAIFSFFLCSWPVQFLAVNC